MISQPRPRTHRSDADSRSIVPAIASRLLAFAGVTAVLFLGVLFLGQDRNLPISFVQEEYAFPYGPLAAGVGQSFAAPAPYLSRVTVTVDARGISTAGFPLNLRIRNDSGEVIAESRQLIDRAGISEPAISFVPIADSKGRLFEIEVQPAEGAEGEIYLPMRAGSGISGETFRDQEGRSADDWSSNLRLEQTVRPLTFFRSIFAADPLIGMALLAVLGLLAGSLAVVLGSIGRALRLKMDSFAASVFGADLTLALVWAAYVLYPVA